MTLRPDVFGGRVHPMTRECFVQEVIDLRDVDGYPEDEAVILAAQSFEISPTEAVRIWDREAP